MDHSELSPLECEFLRRYLKPELEYYRTLTSSPQGTEANQIKLKFLESLDAKLRNRDYKPATSR
jgi:hypothetical protein